MRRAIALSSFPFLVLSALSAQQPLYTLSGEGSGSYPGFGSAVEAAGDLDGDGVPDLIAGGPYESVAGVSQGQARVYSGADGTQLLPSFTDAAGGHFAWSVAGVGDVDGDGVPDLAVGAPQFGGVGVGGKGYVTVRSGADGHELFKKLGDTPGDEFGHAVAGAGDVDLDGVPDWAVGATDDHELSLGAGYVRVFSGDTGAVLHTIPGAGLGGRYGQSLVNAGDVNADGVPDLLVGSSGNAKVQMRSGATGGLLWQKVGPAYFGWDVDRAGDVTGTGVPGVVIGAPNAGRVRVLRADTGALQLEITGPVSEFFGDAVAGLGDLDGDGRDDLAIGAKWTDGPTAPFTGAAWTYSGLGTPLRAYYGLANGDRLGIALAALGDVDGDGAPELALGACQGGSVGPGAVRIFHARPAPRRLQRAR